MKALKCLTMLLLVPLASACSHDDLPEDNAPEELHEVQVAFDFKLDSSYGEKSSRPLETSDDWQKVSDMRIYVFRSERNNGDGSFVYYYPKVRDDRTDQISEQPYFKVAGFEKREDDVWTFPDFEEHVYRIVPMLGKGYYRFLAVGRDDNPDSTPLEINWTKDVTTWTSAIMQNTGGSPRVTEVFTGYPMNDDGTPKTIYLAGQDSFTEQITCRRTVAGVFMYVKNIPERLTTEYAWHADGMPTGAIAQDVEKGVECTVDEVAIVAAGYNADVNLMNRRHGESFVSDNSRFYATRIVSVSTAGMTAEDGLYPEKKKDGTFVFPAPLYDKQFTADYAGGEKADAGNFTIFDKSLYLCFFHISGSGKYYPIKMIPIKIVRSYVHDADSEDICAGDNMISTDGFHYNLVANHLYRLGDENDYLDLGDALKKPELQITVIGNWQADVNIEM